MGMISIRILLFLPLLNISASGGDYCPPFEVTSPCGCTTLLDGGIRLDCITVSSISDIKRSLTSLKDQQIVDVDFQRSKISHIPSDFFDGVRVRQLFFTHCDIGSIGDENKPTFIGLDSTLETIEITFTFKGENNMKSLDISNLKRLKFLQIEGNNLNYISDDWFRNAPHQTLTNVYIMTNDIETLSDNAFAPLKNLKFLWLNNNKLTTLKRSMFPSPAEHLISLDFGYNQINQLPEDMFSNMPSLKEIDLSNNDIKTLPESTWFNAWQQLSFLYLDDNPLKCDSEIDWISNVRRPHVLKGVCSSPPEREGLDLKKLTEQNKF